MQGQPCLYCLGIGREPSVEHVAPVGLGSHVDIVLPRGAVCMECNTSLGREVDEALVHLPEVQMIRGVHGLRNRNGRRLGELDLRSGSLEFGPRGSVTIVAAEERVRWIDRRTISVTLELRRRRIKDQRRRAARSILKMGLAMLYLGRGPTVALSEEWHPARRAIMGDLGVGYLLQGPYDVNRKPDFEASLRFNMPGAQAMAHLKFGGFSLMADLGLGVPNDRIRAWARENGFSVITFEAGRAR